MFDELQGPGSSQNMQEADETIQPGTKQAVISQLTKSLSSSPRGLKPHQTFILLLMFLVLVFLLGIMLLLLTGRMSSPFA